MLAKMEILEEKEIVIVGHESELHVVADKWVTPNQER